MYVGFRNMQSCFTDAGYLMTQWSRGTFFALSERIMTGGGKQPHTQIKRSARDVYISCLIYTSAFLRPNQAFSQGNVLIRPNQENKSVRFFNERFQLSAPHLFCNQNLFQENSSEFAWIQILKCIYRRARENAIWFWSMIKSRTGKINYAGIIGWV